MPGAIERVTEEAWQIPYTLRVDSITNFQHSWADGDDLTVENLIRDGAAMDEAALAKKEEIALTEPLLVDYLISGDSKTVAVNVTLLYPQLSLKEVPAAVTAAREIRDRIQTDYPELQVALTGRSMLNNAFSEAGRADIRLLIPLMYFVLLIVLALTLRSVSGTVATLMVIVFSTVVAMGVAGFMGVKLTPVSMTAPTIIFTLAVADSVHILVSLKALMRKGKSKIDALVEAVSQNFLAVTVTSITTIVGFLALNSLDSPPFRHLGNTTAVGIAAAWLFSLTLLPALISLLPMRGRAVGYDERAGWIAWQLDRLASIVTKHFRGVLIVTAALALGLVSFVPTIKFDDQWTRYFDTSIEFRRDTDFASAHLGGLHAIEFSLEADGPGSVSDPAFLKRVGAFTDFLREQSEVAHAYSLSDIMKRLNKNMHGDDPAFERLPEDHELSAQVLLLYELSLPYGLDLSDRINIDRSATRVTATLLDVSTAETRNFVERAEAWLTANMPKPKPVEATGATVMFSLIAQRNVESMLTGNVIAVTVIAFVIMLSLGSFSLGTLSLIPNAIPILMTFGIWAILVGVVGVAAATVAATSLGIIVDNTVHILTRYLRGRQLENLPVADAIRYAYQTVGFAVIVNALVLACGFAVLAFSTFKINNEMGLLTALAIIVALVIDFLLLPALLMLAQNLKKGRIDAHSRPQPSA